MIELPALTGDLIAFVVCAPLMVLLAIGIVVARKPVHSALCMAGVMIGLAVIYAAQDASFLFVVQIIVYTGAILMLFLFVVMLIGVDTRDSVHETLKGHRVLSVLGALGLAGLVFLAVAQTVFADDPAGVAVANAEHGGNIQGVAALLFTRYVILLEATSALLITAAVGAMVLAHGEKLREVRRQPELMAERVRRYATDGVHPGPDPNSGVYARTNAISAPALLPDGSIAENSVSKALAMRGAVVAVDELRDPTAGAFARIEAVAQDLEGEVK
ncbi:NADH-quinone oxidoreductase subunit J [Arachnia propionica]|uniref:NADH-quinone oxidoreductase subunit J n=1 Tax=Arachnia propionica TaxID=1750 RepID=A0A3P1T2P2_9ACTN|nr:NADH-quinone oxidoreductase subunit J [Arachnia propionica]MDO5083295.1 NADH-quinone oxidoreductase subunit J [Arachnia propionica]RRD03787.1 NADH-quinone oxidoreductase subunit J [Arachnia propionica]